MVPPLKLTAPSLSVDEHFNKVDLTLKTPRPDTAQLRSVSLPRLITVEEDDGLMGSKRSMPAQKQTWSGTLSCF